MGWVERTLLWLGFGLARVAAAVLPLRLLHAYARLWAPVLWALAPGVRRALLANSRYLLGPGAGPRERRAFGVGVLRSFIRFAVEMLTLHRRRPEGDPDAFLARSVGREHYEAALAHGKGVIGLTLHMGNYEVAARLLAHLHDRVAVVYTADPIGAYEQVRSRGRRDARIEEIVVGRSPLFGAEVMRVLREGGVIAACGDVGFPHERGRPVPFLGGRAQLLEWPARIAVRTGAPILPAFVVQDGEPGRYRLEMTAPVVPREGEDAEALLRRLTPVFEAYVRRYPEQWLILHRYWEEEDGAPAAAPAVQDAAT